MIEYLTLYNHVSRLSWYFITIVDRLLAVFAVNRFTTLDPRFATLQSSTLKSSEILWLAVKKKRKKEKKENETSLQLL